MVLGRGLPAPRDSSRYEVALMTAARFWMDLFAVRNAPDSKPDQGE